MERDEKRRRRRAKERMREGERGCEERKQRNLSYRGVIDFFNRNEAKFGQIVVQGI